MREPIYAENEMLWSISWKPLMLYVSRVCFWPQRVRAWPSALSQAATQARPPASLSTDSSISHKRGQYSDDLRPCYAKKKLNHQQAGVYWLYRHKSSGCTVFTTWGGSHVQTGTHTHTHRLIISEDKGEVNVWKCILEACYLKWARFLCWIPSLKIIMMN